MRRRRQFRALVVCTALGAALATPASAIPVVFRWDAVLADPGGIGGLPIPGVSDGDPVVLLVFADNGGTDLIAQTWNNADITRGELTAGATGAYRATYFPPTGFGDPVFQTDGTGQVSNARLVFLGTLNPANTDSLGSSQQLPSLARNLAGSSTGSSLFWGTPAFDTFDESRWSVVPEPATSTLVAIGLVGLATRRRGRLG